MEVVVVVGFKGLRERGRERKERELGSTSTSTKEPRRESALRERGDLIKRKRGEEELEKEWKRGKRRRRRSGRQRDEEGGV